MVTPRQGREHGRHSASDPAPATHPTPRPVKVTIAYCSECGYEPQTLALASALMAEFGHALSSIELIPWLDGSFEVSVGGQLVHSMMREGGFPDHATIAQAVRRHLNLDTAATGGKRQEARSGDAAPSPHTL